MCLVAACAQPKLDDEKPITTSVVARQSGTLPETARAISGGNISQTYVIPIDTGNEAFGARLHLIETAELSLDIQSFLMKPDVSSALISEALLQAADRGVRVRLLLDDIFTTVKDRDLHMLDQHPNIAVRIFNPAARPGPKWASMIGDFARMNRRMHNKSFIADGTFSVTGGRNLADEYFQVNPKVEFADFEVLTFGPAVSDIAASFDLFWNDGWSVPLASLSRPPSAESLSKQRVRLAELAQEGEEIYATAINDPLFDDLSRGRSTVEPARVRHVTDTPEKLKVPTREGEKILASRVLGYIQSAKKQVVIITPYFVPENYGAKLLSEVAQRGVDVRVITNSVASTNHVYTHAGYRRHRVPLISSGVGLNELRADALKIVEPENDLTGQIVMHTKMILVDDATVFVGSMNFDPRSIKINSEAGLFIHSRTLTSNAYEVIDQDLDLYTYYLTQSDEGELQWVYRGEVPVKAATREPGATGWKNFVIRITELLSIEHQL